VNAGAWRRRERTSHQRGSLPDHWLLIDGSGRSVAHACGAICVSSVTWLELGVWLTRSLLRYAARNLSIEKTVPRESMKNTARPSLWARIDSAFPLPCFFSIPARRFLPSCV